MSQFIRVPADSAGKRVNATVHNDGVNDIYTQNVHVSDRNDPDLHQSINNKGEAKIVFDGGAPDFEAWGRTTVSEPNLLDMFKFYQKEYADKFEYHTIGGGAVERDDVLKGMKITTSTASGDHSGIHSHRHFHYRPGNTMTLIITSKFGDTGRTNLQRKIGWFDATDGLYFQLEDTTFSVVIENSLTATKTVVNQANWNGDRLDGSAEDQNLSGVTLDLTKTCIWWIDFQFCGAVRFGAYVNGEKVVCHTIGNFATMDRPFNSSGSFCFSAQSVNTGITSVSSEMHVYCAAIYNDGYDELDRHPITMGHDVTLTTTSFVPVVSFRPAATYHQGDVNRTRVIPVSLSALSDSGSIEIKVEVNPTLTGSTYSGLEGGTEFDTAASAAGGDGSKKIGQLVAAGRSESIDLSESFRIPRDGVTRSYDNSTADHITVSARLLSAGSSKAAIVINALEIE